MADGPDGERLVALETELRYIRQAIDRISVYMDRTQEMQNNIHRLEIQLDQANKKLTIYDTDFALLTKRIAQEEREFEKFKEWATSRWWLLVSVVSVSAPVGGFIIQKLFRIIFP